MDRVYAGHIYADWEHYFSTTHHMFLLISPLCIVVFLVSNFMLPWSNSIQAHMFKMRLRLGGWQMRTEDTKMAPKGFTCSLEVAACKYKDILKTVRFLFLADVEGARPAPLSCLPSQKEMNVQVRWAS